MGLSRSFAVYLAASILAGSVPLLLMPVLTRYLSPADYGVMYTLLSLILLTTPMITVGTLSLVGVEHARLERTAFQRVFSTILWVPLVGTVAMLALYWALGDWLAGLFQVPRAWLTAVPVLAGLGVLPLYMLALLRMRGEPFRFGAVEIATALGNVGLTVCLVILAGLAWQGRLLAAGTVSATVSILAVAWLWRQGYLARVFDGRALREALRYGAGAVPHEMANQSLRLADRLILVAIAGQAAAGQYAVAVQLSSIMLVVLSAFNRAWTPFLFDRLGRNTPEDRAEIVRKTRIAVLGVVALFALFNLAVPLAYDILVAPEFHGSIGYVIWLTLGYLFLGLHLTQVDYLFYAKKTRLLAGITGMNVILHVSLSIVLITRLGPVGAAIAFAVSMGVVMVLTTLAAQRLYPMPWFGTRAA